MGRPDDQLGRLPRRSAGKPERNQPVSRRYLCLCRRSEAVRLELDPRQSLLLRQSLSQWQSVPRSYLRSADLLRLGGRRRQRQGLRLLRLQYRVAQRGTVRYRPISMASRILFRDAVFFIKRSRTASMRFHFTCDSLRLAHFHRFSFLYFAISFIQKERRSIPAFLSNFTHFKVCDPQSFSASIQFIIRKYVIPAQTASGGQVLSLRLSAPGLAVREFRHAVRGRRRR